MDFAKKTVIVTGGSNGIGKGIVSAYASEGAAVIIADIAEAEGRKNAEEIGSRGGSAIYIPTDVREEKDIAVLMNRAMSETGRIDILINNAGISSFSPLSEQTAASWDNILNTNLRSVFLCSKLAASHMAHNESGGAIVNIASSRAVMSEPGSEAYAASKGGIVAITHALAASLSESRITVNSISPGWIETGDYAKLRAEDHLQHFSRRVGKPADIARACLYLTHPDNDFITGENLVIDGGMTRKMIYLE